MHEFNYHIANSVSDAADKINGAQDGALMAGGMTLLPTLKQRLAQYSDIVDLAGISDLAGIRADGGTVSIGATTKHAAVAESSDVKSNIPALAELAGGIGDPQVRNRGTIGGSIANNDPAADYPAACLGLGATIVTNSREIAADDFFTALFETALNEGEIITAVKFPATSKAAYVKFANPASRYALVGVFVSATDSDVRVAVTGAGQNGVFRVPEMESALKANFSADAIAGISVDPGSLASDIHAESDYRSHLITVMAKRAVAKAG